MVVTKPMSNGENYVYNEVFEFVAETESAFVLKDNIKGGQTVLTKQKHILEVIDMPGETK